MNKEEISLEDTLAQKREFHALKWTNKLANGKHPMPVIVARFGDSECS